MDFGHLATAADVRGLAQYTYLHLNCLWCVYYEPFEGHWILEAGSWRLPAPWIIQTPTKWEIHSILLYTNLIIYVINQPYTFHCTVQKKSEKEKKKIFLIMKVESYQRKQTTGTGLSAIKTSSLLLPIVKYSPLLPGVKIFYHIQFFRSTKVESN